VKTTGFMEILNYSIILIECVIFQLALFVSL